MHSDSTGKCVSLHYKNDFKYRICTVIWEEFLYLTLCEVNDLLI